MSENKRDRTGLHKEISSIFKGMPNSKTDEGQRPSGTPAPVRTADTKPKSSAPEKKNQVSKVNKAPQSLPKAVPVKRPRSVPVQRPKAVSVKRPKPVPVQRQEVVSTKHHKVAPAKLHKTMQAKKQKAVYIPYLKIAGIVWAACFVILMLAYVLILKPRVNSTKLIESRLTEKKQIYESALRAAQKETRIQLNEQIGRLQNRMKDFVADFEDSANLTFEISQIANEKKVASFSIKGKENLVLSGKPERKHISENRIVISFNGGFNQFATFLNALERHRPALFVDKFTITRSGQDDSVYRVNLNVAAFVRKQQGDKTTDKRLDQVYGMKI
jgi:Tfp pilus assembly protein PilO